ncbi:MAG: hypothetical protein HeimC3_03150 [Candidatus Heimdallarchaeota archaeon LC_3]|nr:MAG: hypothetical protein HeimC3_03150 [Candidatus Heimdallarchaeota archaeon LC_3]
MRIELLLEALEAPKSTHFQEIDLCYCSRGIFRQKTQYTVSLLYKCSMNCFCAQILDNRVQKG